MEVEEGETVLDAAFRQGISLMHGCKEGQCSSCKSVLIEGDIELLKYSTFALSEMDRDTNHILLCRTLAYSDIEVELLNYDEDLLSRSIAVKDFAARLTAIVPLTHDIFRLEMEIEQPLKFWAGQYVDITVPGKGITRSFSMANPPSEPNRLQFIIKKYGQGAFCPAGWWPQGWRQSDAARSLRHLFAARTVRANGAGGGRLRHVAAVVDPSGPDRLR